MYFKLIRWSGYRFSIFSSAQQSKDEKQGAGYKGLATVGSSPLLLLHRPGAALKIPHCSPICCAHFGPFGSSVVFGGRERIFRRTTHHTFPRSQLSFSTFRGVSLNWVELNICLRTKGECFIITISLYDCSYSVLISVIFRRRNGDKSTFIFATACRERREKTPPATLTCWELCVSPPSPLGANRSGHCRHIYRSGGVLHWLASSQSPGGGIDGRISFHWRPTFPSAG